MSKTKVVPPSQWRLSACYGLMLLLSGCAGMQNLQRHAVAVPMTPPQSRVTIVPSADDADSGDFVTVLPSLDEPDANPADTAPIQFSAEDLEKFGDVWQRMRQGFQMNLDIENDRIAVQRNWYVQRQDFLDRLSARASRYLFHTMTEAEKRGLPTELALLPVIESAYDPLAYSRAQAAGMWQLIPGTAHILGVRQSWWYDGRRDVIDSTRAAYDYLVSLHDKFGDWQLALAAYNAGPGAIQRAIERNQAAGLPTDFWSLRLPAETMSYVPRFLAVAQLVNDPARYGVNFKPILNQPRFREVTTPGQVDLAQVAKLAGISLPELYQYNPAYSHWGTDPEGPRRLLVPVSTPTDFDTQLAALPAPERAHLIRYVVRRGDTLFRVAQRFDISPGELRDMNHLRGNRVHRGMVLVVAQGSAEGVAFAQRQEQRIASRETAAEADKDRKHYRVHHGDTIYKVAHHYGVSASDLASWNRLRLHDHLHAGQSLVVLVDKAADTSTSGNSSHRVAHAGNQGNSGSDDAPAVRRISYEVRRGDTLNKIASRYKVSVHQITHWNGRRHIHPGQELVLYVPAKPANKV